MAEMKQSTSRGEDAVELVGEASCSGMDASPSSRSIFSAIAAESPSFLTWMWIQILTPCSGVWGARGDGLSRPRMLGLAEQQNIDSDVLSRIAASKSTWSEVPGCDIDQVSVPVPHPSELFVWEELKASNPDFFGNFGVGDLKIGRLLAEGGQAQIFEAKFRELDHDLVLKVFKLDAGFSLADFKRHWPHSIRKVKEDCNESRSMQERSCGFVFDNFESTLDGYRCAIVGATLLKGGRFAFVMDRYWGDLRTLIDLIVEDNNHPSSLLSINRKKQPPFSFHDSISIMLQIARGMQGLHAEGVLHRDLKATNVLIDIVGSELFNCKVADYECAMFVQGTGFWRAPEVLLELQKEEKDWIGEIWTEKVDVYSFGMTCYEILTGQISFEGYTKSKWGDVIEGERPFLPNYRYRGLRELVEACWHAKPFQRPTFNVILEKLELL